MKLDRIHAFEIFGNQHWVQRWKGNNYLEMPREVILNNWKVINNWIKTKYTLSNTLEINIAKQI